MLRNLLVLPTLALLLSTVGPVALLAALALRSAGPVYATASPCVRLLVWLAGIEVRVRGREHVDPRRNYLFVANHQSNVDPPILFLSIGRRIKFLAKASLFRLPVLGRAMKVAEFVPVDRQDRERAIRAVDVAADALRRGHDFLVFAEGTRSPDGHLLPFKKGPFVMAIEAGVAVVPVVVRGTRAIQPKGAVALRPGIAEVTFLPPVPVDGLGYEDRTVLLERVRDRMASVLEAPPSAV
ncbi:MAG: lysophospholipid acyltransferase family protein [Acidobacteriota bacterium]